MRTTYRSASSPAAHDPGYKNTYGRPKNDRAAITQQNVSASASISTGTLLVLIAAVALYVLYVRD